MLRRGAAAAALAAGLALPASAHVDSDFSDLWWDADESGWGMGLQRQGDVIFLTLFVYGADGRGTWLVGSEVRPDASAGTASRWRGALLRTRGPGFASSFDAGSVEATPVGAVTLEFSDAYNGTLRYTVDGVAVEKAITRMTWREPSPAGSYHGGFSSEIAQCADLTRAGAYDFLGPLTIVHEGSLMVARFSSNRAGLGSSCTFAGPQRHQGRLSTWSGTFTCAVVVGHDDRGENVNTVTRTGPFIVERIMTTESGLYGELTANDQDCAFRGRFGGTRLP